MVKIFYLYAFLLLAASLVTAQELKPAYQNVAYGPYAKNKLDIYLSNSAQPAPVLIFIHGGAFSGGDKTKAIPKNLFMLCLKNGISVVSINYRLSSDKDYNFKFSDKTPFPPPFADAARAVQFIRSRAAKYNIDKKRLAVSGGSAGGGIALWLSFHNDLADPRSDDPVGRESTKPLCVVALYAQTTYDQEYISREMNYDGYKIKWIDKLFQAGPGYLKSPASKQIRKSISAIDLVDQNDKVAVFLCRGGEDRVFPDMPQARFVHNVIFYLELEKKLKQFKVEYKLLRLKDCKSGQKNDLAALTFLQKAFRLNQPR